MVFYILITLAILGIAAILVGNYMGHDGWVADPVVSILAGIALADLPAFVAFAPEPDKPVDCRTELAEARQSISYGRRQIDILKTKVAALDTDRKNALSDNQKILKAQQQGYRTPRCKLVTATCTNEQVPLRT